ncbi:protease inhibitor I42 family protein [Legionella sp. D16C41]|uniref:protease inhibitor I42 family protein n=1 Tax=Legionella sp. D16C41 TaxID=3402688 RepID=UPI003AF4B80C
MKWMKFLGTTVLLVIMATSYAANKAMTINLKPTDNEFQVVLPANQTTGYQWTLRNYDRSLLRLVSSKYNRPDTNLMGAPGTMVFTFAIEPNASRPKATALVFSYARSWENQGATLQTVTVNFQNTPVTQ